MNNLIDEITTTPKNTSANEVQDASPSFIPVDTPSGLDVVAMGGIGALGIWHVGRMLVRRFFKDETEIAKDRAETNIIALLQEDNASLHKKNDSLLERIDIVAKERNEAVSQLGRFLAESAIYKEKILELQQSMVIMTRKIDEQSGLLHNVLLENASLKMQIDHLEQSNSNLGSEIQNLRQTFTGTSSNDKRI